MALIRYPGSKEKLTRAIWELFPRGMQFPLESMHVDTSKWRYIEPFFGAGAVGFRTMRWLPQSCGVWINDIDRGIAALWQTVRDASGWLIERVHAFEPNTTWFEKFKAEDGDPSIPDPQAGFRKLALHRMSFSGLGCKAGGPIGGREQNGSHDIGCRWSPDAIEKDIRRLSARMRAIHNLEITNTDFREVLAATRETDFIYLDPPYYDQGPNLYKHSMTHEDHEELADILRHIESQWVLSYDDNSTIRELYRWAQIDTLETKYTIATAKETRRKNCEILISPCPA